MSDTASATPANPADPAAAAAAAAAPVTPPAPPAQAPADDSTDWKAEARKWEDRAKLNKTAADELAALKAAEVKAKEDAKSVEEQLSDLRGKFEASVAEAARLRVAQAKGVPAELLADFKGDEAALAAFADRIVAFKGNVEPPKHVVPGVGNTPPTPPTAQQKITAAEASGDRNASLAAKSQLLAQLAMGRTS